MQQRDAELSVLIGMLRKDDAANGSMPAPCASRAPHHKAEGHAFDMASASLRDQTAQSSGEDKFFSKEKLGYEILVQIERSYFAATQTLLNKMQQWHQLGQVKLHCQIPRQQQGGLALAAAAS